MQDAARRRSPLATPIALTAFLVWVFLLAILPNNPVLIVTGLLLAPFAAFIGLCVAMIAINYATWPIQRKRDVQVFLRVSEPRTNFEEIDSTDLERCWQYSAMGEVSLTARRGWVARNGGTSQFECIDATGQLVTVMDVRDAAFCVWAKGLFFLQTNLSVHSGRRSGLFFSAQFGHDWSLAPQQTCPMWINEAGTWVGLVCKTCGQRRFDIYQGDNLRLVTFPTEREEEPTVFRAGGIYLFKFAKPSVPSQSAVR
jgi:hypothetical protein